MNEEFRDYRAGEVLSAREFNKLTGVVERLAREGPISAPGYAEQNVGQIKGRGVKNPPMLMVRLLSDVLPQNSTQYDETGSDYDPNEGYNAVAMWWDDDAKQWERTDTEQHDGNRVVVVLLEDQSGWRPLVAGDTIPVMWRADVGAYVPLETREASIVIINGPATDGYYPASMVAWDSDTAVWFVWASCYVIDVGSAAGAGSTGGFTGTVP